MALAPEEITASFIDAFGESVESTSTFQGQATVVVSPDSWAGAFTHARDVLACDFFTFVSAIDWASDVSNTGESGGDPEAEEEAEEDTYRPPEGDLLQVVGRVSSSTKHHGVTIKANLARQAAEIDTLIGVFGGANWHEREMMEMFGIVVKGHPEPEKIYLTDEFEGHPLLKSFKLGAREVKPWPGDVDVEDMPEDTPVQGGMGGVAAGEVDEDGGKQDKLRSPQGGDAGNVVELP